MQPAQCVLLFLVLVGNFNFYLVTRSYSSRPFLCILGLGYRASLAFAMTGPGFESCVGPLSVTAKMVCLLRDGNQLVMNPGILISEDQPCPTRGERT